MKTTAKFFALLCTAGFFSLSGVSQVTLKPFIGVNNEPADGDSVETIPFSNPPGGYNFQNYVLPQVGDTVNDFKLFTLTGDSMHLENVLLGGKPVFLMAASITCFVSRDMIASFNNLVNTYGSEINFYTVYTVEAHPNIDISPYTTSPGSQWCACGSGQPNEFFKHRQPVTYGDRKDLVDTLQKQFAINAPVLIDGPGNDWWINFGKSPNCALLIDVDGTVYGSNGWFNGNNGSIPDMDVYIDSLLAQTPVGAPSGDEEAEISVYPNPFSDQTTISVSSRSALPYNLILTDYLGREVKRVENISQRRYYLSNEGLDEGIYFYNILHSGRQISAGKLVLTNAQ